MTELSGGHLLVLDDARVPVDGLSNNAARVASVKSPRAFATSADDSHGVVAVARTESSSVVPPSQEITFDGGNARFQRRSSGQGLSSATGTALPPTFSSERYFARLNPIVSPDSNGRYVIYFIEEESPRLATSSLFFKRPKRKESHREIIILPPARAPLQKTPTVYGSFAVL